jgi:hypothetical protein
MKPSICNISFAIARVDARMSSVSKYPFTAVMPVCRDLDHIDTRKRNGPAAGRQPLKCARVRALHDPLSDRPAGAGLRHTHDVERQIGKGAPEAFRVLAYGVAG